MLFRSVNAAEVQSVTEEAGEPESNTIEDKTGEETPAPSSDSLENEEKSEVPEGTQTTDEGTVDPSEDSTDTSLSLIHIYLLKSRLTQPRGLKYVIITTDNMTCSVETYAASWIGIWISNDISNLYTI